MEESANLFTNSVFLYKSPTELLFVIPEQSSRWKFKEELRIAIKFYIRLQKTATGTHEMKKVSYVENILPWKYLEFLTDIRNFKDLKPLLKKAKVWKKSTGKLMFFDKIGILNRHSMAMLIHRDNLSRVNAISKSWRNPEESIGSETSAVCNNGLDFAPEQCPGPVCSGHPTGYRPAKYLDRWSTIPTHLILSPVISVYCLKL